MMHRQQTQTHSEDVSFRRYRISLHICSWHDNFRQTTTVNDVSMGIMTVVSQCLQTAFISRFGLCENFKINKTIRSLLEVALCNAPKCILIWGNKCYIYMSVCGKRTKYTYLTLNGMAHTPINPLLNGNFTFPYQWNIADQNLCLFRAQNGSIPT